MKKVVLNIDTSDRNKSVVGLEIDGKSEKQEVATPLGSGTAVLSAIETLFYKNKVKMSDISEIGVATGPGSYTGLRVGASIANTLSWLLKIPINGKPAGSIITPQYTATDNHRQ